MSKKIPTEEVLSKKYNRLQPIKEIIRRTSPTTRERVFFLCECDCGNEIMVYTYHLRTGHTKSCGCLEHDLLVERNTKHNLSKHPIAKHWYGLFARVNNDPLYAERKICSEWCGDEGLKNFIEWSEKNGFKKGLELDRRDNEYKGERAYSPEKCRWVTPRVNRQNRSTTKLSVDIVQEIRNAKMLLGNLITGKELASSYGVSTSSIASILNYKTWV